MQSKKAQANIQKFGATLSAMVMPNIGVFIGWGLLTALFIPTGWCPNEYFNKLVSPILTYLLPVLIGYTAGYNVYGRRGGVIGAFATMGTVVGSSVTMLVGGMIMGPIAASLLKKFDKAVEGKVKTGLEMLVDNFALGFIGVALCILGYVGIAPALTAVQNFLSGGVQFLTDRDLIPLTALFVQPAQILFLNNAINHGILIPLGLQQAATTGKSILFLIEANGANWVGLAAAFAVFGDRKSRESAPGAVIIMFFGGIAEVCFPYCLMQPITILGPIAGNMFSLFILNTFGGGAVGPVSPGSVFAFFMMTPKSAIVPNAIGYFGSLIITFLVTGLILKFTRGRDEDDAVIEGAAAPVSLDGAAAGSIASLKRVIFACDAGMGSSAMGVSILKERLKKAGLTPKVDHVAVAEIPSDADVVVTNVNLAERAKMSTEGKIPILTIDNFMAEDEYTHIVSQIVAMTEKGGAAEQKELPAETRAKAQPAIPVFREENIVLGQKLPDKRSAIDACADILVGGGYVDESYRQDMIVRCDDVSVYLGNGIALPHGLSDSRDKIKTSGICFIQVPDGVDFDGETAYLVIGVAGRGEEHMDILGKIANTLMDEDNVRRLRKARTKREVMEVLDF